MADIGKIQQVEIIEEMQTDNNMTSLRENNLNVQ